MDLSPDCLEVVDVEVSTLRSLQSGVNSYATAARRPLCRPGQYGDDGPARQKRAHEHADVLRPSVGCVRPHVYDNGSRAYWRHDCSDLSACDRASSGASTDDSK